MDTPGANSGLSVSGLVKDFGGVRALDGANFAAAPGTIHGLVGQNGAGKSTLIKILAGLHCPNAGIIKIGDVVYTRLSPVLSERLGLQFIHQERFLVPTFTVAEALFLGSESRVGPFIDRRAIERQSVNALRHYFDLTIPPKTLIGQLSAAQQQTVQITRALLRKP
ncbi:MAG: sugar ABC transporter ATP-binding protein, partial [Verrucomicrobia bacterium]|nr:sugar ABC transporter ATP-binding protein [Verrucomicrobiota bacterium]